MMSFEEEVKEAIKRAGRMKKLLSWMELEEDIYETEIAIIKKANSRAAAIHRRRREKLKPIEERKNRLIAQGHLVPELAAELDKDKNKVEDEIIVLCFKIANAFRNLELAGVDYDTDT